MNKILKVLKEHGIKVGTAFDDEYGMYFAWCGHCNFHSVNKESALEEVIAMFLASELELNKGRIKNETNNKQ